MVRLIFIDLLLLFRLRILILLFVTQSKLWNTRCILFHGHSDVRRRELLSQLWLHCLRRQPKDGKLHCHAYLYIIGASYTSGIDNINIKINLYSDKSFNFAVVCFDVVRHTRTRKDRYLHHHRCHSCASRLAIARNSRHDEPDEQPAASWRQLRRRPHRWRSFGRTRAVVRICHCRGLYHEKKPVQPRLRNQL